MESPTGEPTTAPGEEPAEAPTGEPTEAPTGEPTDMPTGEPTVAPGDESTIAPSEEPAASPAPITIEPGQALFDVNPLSPDSMDLAFTFLPEDAGFLGIEGLTSDVTSSRTAMSSRF
jgi:hypothetical protein